MKKYILIAFLIFCTSISYSQQDSRMLYVKIMTSDCPSCYGGFALLDGIAKRVPVQLVFPTMEKKRAEYFVKQKMSTLKTKFPIITSDSLYNALQKASYSEIILKENGVEIKRWDLNKFDGKLPDEFVMRMQLPDSIILNSVSVGFCDKYIILSDATYNAAYLINKDNFTLNTIVSGEKLDPIPAMRKIAPASIQLFNSLRSSLVLSNTDKIRLMGGSQKSGKYSLLSATVFIAEATDSMNIIKGHPGVLTQFEDNKAPVFVSTTREPDSIYFGGYKILQSVGDDMIIADIISMHQPKYMLARFKKYDNDSLYFDKLYPFTLPNSYQKAFANVKTSIGVNYIMAYPYLLTQWSNEMWNVETEEQNYLPLVQTKLSFDERAMKIINDYTIISAIVADNNILRVLLMLENKQLILKDINLSSMTIVAEQTIPAIKNLQSSLYFYDKNTLLYVANESIYTISI